MNENKDNELAKTGLLGVLIGIFFIILIDEIELIASGLFVLSESDLYAVKFSTFFVGFICIVLGLLNWAAILVNASYEERVKNCALQNESLS